MKELTLTERKEKVEAFKRKHPQMPLSAELEACLLTAVDWTDEGNYIPPQGPMPGVLQRWVYFTAVVDGEWRCIKLDMMAVHAILNPHRDGVVRTG